MNALRNLRPSFIFRRSTPPNGAINKRERLFSAGASSPSSLVSVREDEATRTATILLQRPPVNSLSMELLQEITAAIKDLEKKQFKGFILTSSSPEVFSAGLDIMEMYNPKEERFRAFWKSLQLMWKTLYLTPLAAIAAVNGHAIAGGCLLALSCDYRVMLDSRATIGMNETALGILAPRWFRSVLASSVGFRPAEKALMLGSLFGPQQALALGLVDELAASPEQLQTQVQLELARWAKIPGPARQMTKISLRKPFVDELSGYESQELEEVAKFVMTDNVQKGLGRYVESLKAKKA